MRQVIKKVYSLDAGFAGLITSLAIFNLWMINNNTKERDKLQSYYLERLKEINTLRK